MKKFHRPMLLLVMVCALLLLATGVAYAKTTAAEIPWWTVDGGGGHSSSTHFRLDGSIGQADAGRMSGEHVKLYGGFWVSGGEADIRYQVFLPTTLK